jgi:hypothetical protein
VRVEGLAQTDELLLDVGHVHSLRDAHFQCRRDADGARPLPIDRAFAELALAIDHCTTMLVAARARRYLPGRGMRSRSLRAA